MISVEQALQSVLAVAQPTASDRAQLREALGRVLAEDIASDIDSPPHDKSLVDGYAVSSAAFTVGGEDTEIELAVVEQVTAGDVPTCSVGSGNAIRIMTGAPIPAGADAVVMLEETQWQAEDGTPLGVVRFSKKLNFREGQNIMRRGTSLRSGQVVLESGTVLGPEHVGLLAEVGRADVAIIPAPRVAVLPTGDELVDAGFLPGPGKIRNSNGPMLVSCVQQAGAIAQDLGVGRDNRDQLAERIGVGLGADVLLVAGGVSAGVHDLVPQVLEECGVQQIFHKVRFKPGKPLWFGQRKAGLTDQGQTASTLVFGLPGNPVSSFACFQLFVAPALARLAGRTQVSAPRIAARLSDDFHHRGDRATYYPARVEDGEIPIVHLVRWHGSADLRSLVDANAFAVFPDGQQADYRQGDQVECLMFPGTRDFI